MPGSRTLLRTRHLQRLAAIGLLVVLAGVVQLDRAGTRFQPVEQFSASQFALTGEDRILILAPHPDDETIACGGIIQKAVAMGLPVRVVFLTNGDNNEWSFVLYRKRPELLPGQVKAMGLVRHDEALAAAGILGLRPEQLTFLGYPDFGTLDIWLKHWGSEPPLRSMLTRVTQVPYASAYRPGAPYKGEEILSDLKAIIGDFRPTKLFLSHPADRNPDHLALYTFTRIALLDLGMSPQLYPYLVHASRWPEPRGAAPDRLLQPPAYLAEQVPWWTSPLSPEQITRKLEALKAHRTQYEANTRYLPSFIRANELFGDYPEAVLATQGAEVALETGSPESGAPEELGADERASFVGLESPAVSRSGNDLVLSIALSKPLAGGVTLSAYLFGYRRDQPFAAMAKIHVNVSELSQAVYDQSRELKDTGVQISRNSRDIVVRVPLALLGDPDRALVHVRTKLDELPLDSTAWRLLDLKVGSP